MGTLPQLASSTNRFKISPLHAGKSTNQNPGPSDQNQSCLFSKNPFLLPHVFPWLSFIGTSSQTLGFPCPNSCHVYNTKYTHFCHFPYSSHLYFSGFTLSFLLHFPCNSLHVTYQHFQMTKRVYHVSIPSIFPNLHQVSKMS